MTASKGAFCAALVVLCALVLRPQPARACGAFAGRRGPSDSELYKRTPYLAIEQTLILWDRDTFIEDFIREARFAKTGESFGFVVPTPGRPEVFKVDASPFPELRKNYPFTGRLRGGDNKAGGGGGASIGHAAPAVEVLSHQRIGSFDVTVLTATDAGALDGWLAKNGFAMTTEAQPWLRHYVELQFYFVAFRYAEPPAGAGDGMTSETVRIRFKSAAPFYPYLEPDHPAGVLPPKERMLTAWLVTQDEMTPVVNRTSPDGLSWKTPWVSGGSHDVLPANFVARVPGLAGAFDIRSKSIKVQAFRDLRTSRSHLGDALFAYQTPHDLSAADVAALRPLLPVLDPTIPPAAPAALGDKKRPRCASSAIGAGADTVAIPALLLVVAVAALRRRTRRRAASRLATANLAAVLVAASLLLVVACRRGKPSESGTPSERAVVALLSGHRDAPVPWAPEARLVSTVTITDTTGPNGLVT